MTITIELPADIEAQLRESAARGDSEAMKRILTKAVELTVQLILQATPQKLTKEEFQARTAELTELFGKLTAKSAPLSDYALTRESIYEDHP